MGCISSKFLAPTDLDPDISARHVVSLTSTTYGVLSLDHHGENHKEEEGGDGEEVKGENTEQEKEKEKKRQQSYAMRPPRIVPSPVPLYTPKSKKRNLKVESPSPEIINTWELMKDLSSPAIKPTVLPQPSDLSNSPRSQKRRLLAKENRSPSPNPNRVLRPFSSSANRQLQADAASPRKLQKESGAAVSKRCLSPLFDPENRAASLSQKARDLLGSFEPKCPPNGESSLVLYTTTLRGIRKTFEDCNAVRSGIEAYDVKFLERDISMDSGFREELKELVGRVRIPLLFAKGRLIGGAEEVVRLEEEGKLGLLLEGIPRREGSGVCRGCGGVRFVMCRECSGSCKVLDEEEKKTVKCEGCNENGLIHCPLCS